MGTSSSKAYGFSEEEEKVDLSVGRDPAGILTSIQKTESGFLIRKKPPTSNVTGYLSSADLFNLMVIGWSHPCILDPRYCFMLDCRSQEAYDKSHVTFASHYSELDKDLSQILTAGKKCRFTYIVLYGTKNNSPALEDILSRLKRYDIFAQVLFCGYDTFERKYPFLCTAKLVKTADDRQNLISSYPSAILEGSLYLGNCAHSQSRSVIDTLKINHIINISSDIKCPFKDRCKYLRFKREDEDKENLLPCFNTAADFIADAIKNGNVVLVHCRAGVSRSATVVMAFLMKYYALSLQDAYQFVKKRREIVAPNRGFRNQLMQYEEILFGRKVSDIMEVIYR